MKARQKLVMAAITILSAALFAARAPAQTPAQARNVVLVHGSWADGSSWSEVISRLQAAGLRRQPTRLHGTTAIARRVGDNVGRIEKLPQ
jgi:ABC-type proline/glycine betaine transport system substrate-binding protein